MPKCISITERKDLQDGSETTMLFSVPKEWTRVTSAGSYDKDGELFRSYTFRENQVQHMLDIVKT